MASGFLFEKDVFCEKCNSFNTAVTAADRIPASTGFIDMSQYDHGVFIIGIGTLTTAADFQVYQDTSATETASIKVITDAVVSVAADDDNQWMTVEFSADQMDQDNGFRYVTIVPSGGAGGDDYFCVFFLGFKARTLPVTQPANYTGHVAVVS